VLGNPAEPLVGDNQVIRLFAKAVYEFCAQRPVDPNWEKRGRDVQQYELRVTRLDMRFKQAVEEAWEEAKVADRWKGTGVLGSAADYWAAGVLAYFNAAGQNHAPESAPRPISTRQLLREYDPRLHRIVAETMAYDGHVDWSLQP
jgi:hypothetical protein